MRSMNKKWILGLAGILLGAGLAVLLVLRFSPKTALDLALSAELRRAGLEIKTTRVRNHDISYAVGGPRDKPVLLLIHGFAADKSNWIRFSRHLTRDYRVFAPDLPGHGDSTRDWKQSYNLFFQVEMLKEFADRMGLDKFHMAGNSMGGNISGLFTLTHPDRLLSLGLFNTGGVKSPRESEHRRIMRKEGRNSLLVNSVEDFDRLLKFTFVEPPSIPDSVKAYFAERAVKRRPFNDKIYKDLYGPRKAPLGNRLREIRVPTLVLWGDTDRIIDVSTTEVLKREIRGAKIIIMEKCGHAPMIERPEETARHYREFLTGLAPR